METNPFEKTKKVLQHPQVEGVVNPPVSGSSQVNVGKDERILSVVAGALMVYWGLNRLTKNSLWMSLTGGYLIYRGATGFCTFNNLLGRNTHQNHLEPIGLTRTVTIDKPREEIYAFWRHYNFIQPPSLQQGWGFVLGLQTLKTLYKCLYLLPETSTFAPLLSDPKVP